MPIQGRPCCNQEDAITVLGGRMGLRKFKRDVAKAKMKKAGIIQPTKTKYKNVDDNGNAVIQIRKSFFAAHWRDK